MGLHTPLVPGLTPDAFAVEAIASHIRQNLKQARNQQTGWSENLAQCMR
jgi:hypothetical protein